jgi:Transposase IS66 family
MRWKPACSGWKKGGPLSQVVAQKWARLQTILAERASWADQLLQVNRMHGWVLWAEHLLDGSWAEPGEVVSNATVASRFDAWREHMATLLTEGSLSHLERECLSEFLQVLSNLRPYLVQCYDRKDFPRTNNEMERSIRALKTQYRRISGRKNWNAYLLRYGRCVAYASWWEQDAVHRQQLVARVAQLDRTRWREVRRETTTAHSEQLTRFRFRHKRAAYLSSLEERWATAVPTLLLP